LEKKQLEIAKSYLEQAKIIEKIINQFKELLDKEVK